MPSIYTVNRLTLQPAPFPCAWCTEQQGMQVLLNIMQRGNKLANKTKISTLNKENYDLI
jgi:hypothetical protein